MKLKLYEMTAESLSVASVNGKTFGTILNILQKVATENNLSVYTWEHFQTLRNVAHK
jgi:hypothetical protein